MKNFNLELLEKKNKDLLADLSYLKGQNELVTQQTNEIDNKLNKFKHKRELFIKSVELLTVVQKMTRDKIKEGFEQIVTYALRSILGEGYSFVLEFGRRGNLQEVDFKIITPKRKEANDPMDSMSGGVLDVVSFALRVALIELSKPKMEGFIALDEPTKFVNDPTNVFLPKVSQFFKIINRKINRQLIITTLQSALVENAGNVIDLNKIREEGRQTEKGGRKK